MRKHNVNEINLRVNEVRPFVMGDESGVLIMWSSDIGFGEYTIRSTPSISNPEKKRWLVESECMDTDEDKAFGKKLLELWLDQCLVIE